jgi:iron complex transport system ATP-binding protein
VLRAEHLTLAVPGRTLCHDLSLELRPGQCWCVLGRNGTGKTTLLQILAGLAAPAEGAVWLDSQPLDASPRRERARRIGVLLQDDPHAFWGTVLEYVLLGRYPHRHGLTRLHEEDEAAARTALEHVEMSDAAQRPLATLSGGERQRVRLAALLAQAPDIYLLDEPLQHLDLAHQGTIVKMLRRLADQGKTVLAVLHETAWVGRYFDHALLLHDDGPASGPAADTLTAANLERLYRCPMAEAVTEWGRVFIPRV